MIETRELSTHLLKAVAKGTTPQRNAILEPNQKTDRLLSIQDQ